MIYALLVTALVDGGYFLMPIIQVELYTFGGKFYYSFLSPSQNLAAKNRGGDIYYAIANIDRCPYCL